MTIAITTNMAARCAAAYELSPGVKPLCRSRAPTRRVHDLNTDFSGYQRNSKGLTGLVGSTFELTQPAHRRYRRSATRSAPMKTRVSTQISGLIGNASLIWTANALTTVKLTGTSAVGETTIPGVSGELSATSACSSITPSGAG